jgi:HEPN domain-containing protein
MPPEESQYAMDWLKVAEKDWRRMGQALDDSDAEEAGFWLQQAIEKYLKAYLLSKGWVLRKVHDLEVLLNEAARHKPAFGRYGLACGKISGYYLSERYPFMDSLTLTLDEVAGSRDEVTELVELIRRDLE